jgi:hypothetical protein
MSKYNNNDSSADVQMRNVLAASIGDNGFKVIADTTRVVGNFIAVLAVNGNAVLAMSTDTKTTVSVGDRPINGHTVLEGSIFIAPFTAIELTSGTVYAYYA